jgi:hypothetical protein
VNNPVGAERLAPLLEVVDVAGLVLLVASMAASAASAIHRFRRSRGVERLQMKWLVVGASLAAAVYLANIAVWGYFALSDPGGPRPGWAFALEQVMSVSFAAIPIAVGIAIFRYRLYDIDLIINRALVYSTLTAVLALAYAGGVLGLGTVVRSLSGESSNSLAVAASTLLVAALFRPARRRIQAFIDRRFYPRKYDAARTIERFSERLRDEVDLDQLTSDLVATVGDVMQPTHVSLRLTAAGGPAAVGSPAP